MGSTSDSLLVALADQARYSSTSNLVSRVRDRRGRYTDRGRLLQTLVDQSPISITTPHRWKAKLQDEHFIVLDLTCYNMVCNMIAIKLKPDGKTAQRHKYHTPTPLTAVSKLASIRVSRLQSSLADIYHTLARLLLFLFIQTASSDVIKPRYH